MKNKTSQYFKYAIGEIILVVIGILIALQINNWNEERKSQTKELNLYKKLLSDVRFNQKEIENKILAFKEHDDLYYHIYQESRKKASFDSTLHYGKLRWGFSVNLKLRNLYENQMNTVSNREISDAFIRYIMVEQSAQNFSEVFNDFKKDIVRPYITKNNLVNTDSIYAGPRYQEVNTKNTIKYAEMKKLYDTQEFDQLLSELKVKTASFFGWLNRLKEVNEELEVVLEKSINPL